LCWFFIDWVGSHAANGLKSKCASKTYRIYRFSLYDNSLNSYLELEHQVRRKYEAGDEQTVLQSEFLAEIWSSL